MTRTELEKEMRAFTGGGFITRKKLADFMGKKDPHNVDKYLAGIVPVSARDYFIKDVAEQIMIVGFR